MKKYFLHNGAEQQGPFDIEELKSKNITKDTPIWYDGISEWTTAGNIHELKDILSTTPPAFERKITTPPVQKPFAQQKVFLDKPKESSSIGRRLLIFAGIVVLVLIGIFVFKQVENQQHDDSKDTIRNNITSYVTVENNEYTYSKLGGISNLEITVTNNTEFLIDNVKVRVVYIKKNGDVWDSKTIDFNLINPHGQSTINMPDTQRGTDIQNEIVSIKSTALGLN